MIDSFDYCKDICISILDSSKNFGFIYEKEEIFLVLGIVKRILKEIEEKYGLVCVLFLLFVKFYENIIVIILLYVLLKEEVF